MIICGGWFEYLLIYDNKLFGSLYSLYLPLLKLNVMSKKSTFLRLVSRSMAKPISLRIRIRSICWLVRFYIYIYTYIHTYICIYMHIYMYVYIYVYVYKHDTRYIYIYIYIYVSKHWHILNINNTFRMYSNMYSKQQQSQPPEKIHH